MTKEEILIKAIEKATKNGYDLMDRMKELNEFITISSFVVDLDYHGFTLESIIFSHQFAKAFWGNWKNDEERFDDDCYDYPNYKRWQWQLMQIVLEEDPIKYLEKFL